MTYYLSLLGPILFFLAIDFYAFRTLKTAFINNEFINFNLIMYIYWGLSFGAAGYMILYRYWGYKNFSKELTILVAGIMFSFFVFKVICILFLLTEDFYRLVYKVVDFINPKSSGEITLSRSQFLSKVASGIALVPSAAIIYGIIQNRYNYKYHYVNVPIYNLPDGLENIKIVQLSDIHSGSFSDTKPIESAVQEINKLDPDLILFTGDLVNNLAKEMESYIEIFGSLKAKYGVFSVMGNHDYGDYVPWNDSIEKNQNISDFYNVHKKMGWDLLLNSNRILEINNEKLALIGVENWGKGRFAKYGDLNKAYSGIENIKTKILMSHDPSHWDEVVRKQFPDIDLTLSGHTHGFQFGIESKWLKWSPSQFVYKQWAGLYQEKDQYLYVNRGFGFLGYPGRIGILPEVTILNLKKA